MEEPDRLAYQYLLVGLQGARTTALVLFASVLALTVIVLASYPTIPWLAFLAALMEAVVALFLWRYSEYLGAIKSAAKRYALQPSDANLVEILRSEIVPREVGMAG